MKKISLLIALLAFSFNAAQAKEWKDIRIGVEGAYPPFSKTEADGSVTGFDIDLANALCAEMKARCTYIKQDWDGIIPALLARKFDAVIATIDITEERLKMVAFTDKYQHIPARFVALKGSEYQASTAFMAGKKIGVQRATSMDLYISDNYPDAQIKRYGSADEAYLDLKAGRLDFILADSAAIAGGLLDKDGGDKFAFIGPKFTDPKWFGAGAGIATRKQNQDLVEQFNRAITAIRADGTYNKIQDKYFSFDVYGSEL
ncbi:ABC transporter substrate-binding protein [Psychromonas antarctica]|uniref:ABC transporter substrate-binding protein n=1 Tax=Psychromonas antarctica TaxID=67573 RepID=UPI001EE82FA4|nr:ABC transporter substrate-binding protein [Psychromonas antarctica]MCG6200977.1 ABC transporter substrate-binding protein [Psychromonas antarctica]